jgi:hypothetical protein
MTYNFDPDKWFDNELRALQHTLSKGEITRAQYDEAVDALEGKLADMWRRLDGSYRVT